MQNALKQVVFQKAQYAVALKNLNQKHYPGLQRATRERKLFLLIIHFLAAWKWQGKSHDLFEAGKVRILTVTWNMAGQEPRGAPHYDIFHMLNNTQSYHDIYVVTAQECLSSIAGSMVNTSKKVFDQALSMRLGPDYCLVRSVSLQALHMVVFARRELVPHISLSQSQVIKLGGDKGSYANKGGVRICFKLASSYLCFVGAHMSAHSGMHAKRAQDFESILRQLVFRKNESKKFSELNWSDSEFDAVVLAGDLNYRNYLPLDVVKRMLENNQYEQLMACEELTIEKTL